MYSYAQNAVYSISDRTSVLKVYVQSNQFEFKYWIIASAEPDLMAHDTIKVEAIWAGWIVVALAIPGSFLALS